MTGGVIPISAIRRRIPVVGRLRMGKQVPTKEGKMRPTSVDKWIATSPEARYLETLADLYGGTVEPWPRQEGQFVVETEANSIEVVLGEEPLHQSYELWDGPRCRRRCDGDQMIGYPKEGEPVQRSCLCQEAGIRSCALKTRLSVIIPQLPLAGVWRVDTGSENAAEELPGMVDTILAVDSVGFPAADLRIERRDSPGRKYVVPMLAPRVSFNELAGRTAPELDVPIVGELMEGDGWND